MPARRPRRNTTKLKRPTTAVKRPTKGTPQKLDLYAKHKNEYVASAKKPGIVRVGPARYLSTSGRSAPESEPFNRAIGALYTVAFTIKMARKAAGQDYAVTRLEGLWSFDSAHADPSSPATVWNWELLLRVPPFVTEKEVKKAIEELLAKGKNADVRNVRLADITEGECVQMLHVGPYTAEKPTLDKMREFAGFAGRTFSGRHHEIYLSDPRRVKPEKLKTILRQPLA
jgi:hypothetical protein